MGQAAAFGMVAAPGQTTGQRIGGVIGAAIGAYVGGPVGAIQGYSIGADIPGILDPIPAPSEQEAAFKQLGERSELK